MRRPVDISVRLLFVAIVSLAAAAPVRAEETVESVGPLYSLPAEVNVVSAHPYRSVAAVPPAARAKAEQIREALDQRVSLDFVDTPFDEIVQYLAATYRIPIRLKKSQISDEGIYPEDGVTIRADDITLRSALEWLLDELNLDFAITHESLVITASSDYDETMESRVYPVADLIMTRADVRDYDSLISLLTRVVSPETWDGVGGPAGIEPYGDTLVIRQTYRGHERIEQLLAAIRAAVNAP